MLLVWVCTISGAGKAFCCLVPTRRVLCGRQRPICTQRGSSTDLFILGAELSARSTLPAVTRLYAVGLVMTRQHTCITCSSQRGDSFYRRGVPPTQIEMHPRTPTAAVSKPQPPYSSDKSMPSRHPLLPLPIGYHFVAV